MDFSKPPTYSRYRSLRLTKPPTVGYDVYALQTALDALGATPGAFDGIFGPLVDKAVRSVQRALDLEDDGVVGPATWAAAVTWIARRARNEHSIAIGLLYGQLAHESGLRGGNYSPARDDGSYDAGVAQRNTSFTPAEDGFNVPESIDALAKNTRAYHDLFSGLPERRRWTLAAGAHNAPAYACWYARAEGASKVKANQTAKPGKTATGLFNAYLQSVTAHLRV